MGATDAAPLRASITPVIVAKCYLLLVRRVNVMNEGVDNGRASSCEGERRMEELRQKKGRKSSKAVASEAPLSHWLARDAGLDGLVCGESRILRDGLAICVSSSKRRQGHQA